MKALLLLSLGLLSVHAVATGVPPSTLPLPEAQSQPAQEMTNPALQRQQIFDALLRADVVGLFDATAGEEGLESFLTSRGDAQTEQATRERIAEKTARGELDSFDQSWARLLAADGVEQSMLELYPKWQQQLPQTLAMAQTGMLGMASAIAQSKTLTALERAQFTELQWAVSGWLARTDFADRALFEKVLREAQGLVRASGVDNPELLEYSTPQQRVDLANQALRSAKKVAALYGIDADAILRSVRVEQIERNGEKARIRTSIKVLGVAISFDEELAWSEGQWIDAAALTRARESSDDAVDAAAADAQTQPDAPADADAAAAWPAADVLAEPAAAPASISDNGGCHAPE